MQQRWTIDGLIDPWTLLPAERELLGNKTGATRLSFTVMLKAFQHEGRFSYNAHEVPLGQYGAFNWRSRNSTYQRQEIRAYCGFRVCTRKDGDTLTDWLSWSFVSRVFRVSAVTEKALVWLRQQRIEPPSAGWLQRFVDSAARRSDVRL